jgi:GNAT superfamily N-acetyltransferase
MEISFRVFKQNDIEFAVAQTSRESWDPTADSFRIWLAHDPDGCFIAESDGRRVGMVTTTCFAQTGWIGNVIVPPEFRSCGIGRRLMNQAVEHLAGRGIRTLRLEADPPGVKLYRSLGFVVDYESLRFEIKGPYGSCDPTAERIERRDLPEVLAFDAEHFGDDRSRLLGMIFDVAESAHWLRDGDHLRGYAFVVPSRSGLQVGPGVATDRDTADALLQTILANAGDTMVHLGIPESSRDTIASLEAHGFRRDVPVLRMVYGEKIAAGRPENTFAIAGGATG